MTSFPRLVRTVSFAWLLAAVSAAQAGGNSSDVPAPKSDPIPSGATSTLPVASWENLLASAEPARTPSVMTRSRLDAANESELAFTEVPGGIVLGLPARPQFGERTAVALVEHGSSKLALRMADGSELALPAAQPAILHAALHFASHGAGHWVIDVDGNGSVLLARELVDAPAGLVAVRADLSPLFFMPADVDVKSNLLDRDVRIAVDPMGANARLEVDLELRFYRSQLAIGARESDPEGAVRVGTFAFVQAGVDSNGRPLLVAPPETGEGGKLLATNLSELAELAGWIGFFRWAVAAELDGLEAVRASLDGLELPRVSTPRSIADRDRSNWVRGAGLAPASDIPDWMREHAERVSRERAAAEGR